ncbi:hypothetical protein K488DRAFT_39110, partial [Vararia minispora EC-137]
PAPSRSVAASALRKAGLMDGDARMHDASGRQGGRKGANKIRSHRPRLVDGIKDSGAAARNSVAARLAAVAAARGETLHIRGAAQPGPSGSLAAARTRRNALSLNGTKTGAGARVVGKPIEVWRQFVQKRWNPEIRFLNLERMSEDELLSRARLLPPGMPGSSGKEAAVIFKLASQLKPPVRTLSLANNQLTNLAAISTLAHYLPNLANLSLENNNIRHWRDLDAISAISDRKDKLSKLRELILLGNPIRNEEYQKGRGDNYKNFIIRRFPTLEMLDQEAVAKIAFDSPEASASSAPHVGPMPPSKTFPSEMMPSFVTGVDNALITGFLGRYFPLYDTNRAALREVYHESATFSLQANTSIPSRARIEGFQYKMPNQRNLEWAKYFPHSRNLSRIAGQLEKVKKMIHTGRDAVITAMQTLPKTKHEVAGSPEKFCIDAWPVNEDSGRVTLFLSIHGQFIEEPANGIRSFDRSLVIAPALDGSLAKMAGWDVEVLSDQLVIRAYSSHESWKPGPLLVQAADPSAAVPAVPALPPALQAQLSAIPEPQRTMVGRVVERTRLNVQFAVDCLQNNGWNFDVAVANFEQVKGTLGPEAFL